MTQKPKPLSEPIIDVKRWKSIFFYAAILSLTSISAVFFSHYIFHRAEAWSPELSNNLVFFSLIFAQLLHVFNMGKTGTHFFNSEVFKNRYVWLATGSCLVILALVILIPLPAKVLSITPMAVEDWLIAISAALVAVVIIQAAKLLKFVRQ